MALLKYMITDKNIEELELVSKGDLVNIGGKVGLIKSNGHKESKEGDYSYDNIVLSVRNREVPHVAEDWIYSFNKNSLKPVDLYACRDNKTIEKLTEAGL